MEFAYHSAPGKIQEQSCIQDLVTLLSRRMTSATAQESCVSAPVTQSADKACILRVCGLRFWHPFHQGKVDGIPSDTPDICAGQPRGTGLHSAWPRHHWRGRPLTITRWLPQSAQQTDWDQLRSQQTPVRAEKIEDEKAWIGRLRILESMLWGIYQLALQERRVI